MDVLKVNANFSEKFNESYRRKKNETRNRNEFFYLKCLTNRKEKIVVNFFYLNNILSYDFLLQDVCSSDKN